MPIARGHRTTVGAGALLGAAALAVVVVAGGPRDARAQEKNSDATFAVSYMQVANDCGDEGMTLTKGEVVLADDGKGKISVTIPGVPTMKGQRTPNGKFKAQSRGKSSRPGIQGKFSASGKAAKGTIQMVFIAEFYRGRRPLCTQSWSAQGSRKK